jgi:hypothetical protein
MSRPCLGQFSALVLKQAVVTVLPLTSAQQRSPGGQSTAPRQLLREDPELELLVLPLPDVLPEALPSTFPVDVASVPPSPPTLKLVVPQ